VTYPTAGWLAVQGSKKPSAFIPYPQQVKQSLPEQLRLILGGRMTVEVPVRQHRGFQPSASLLPVRLTQTQPHTYKAGPFIAILTSDGNRTFRGNRKNFIDLIRMGRKMGVTIFVLTPSGIQPGKSTVRGFIHRPLKTGDPFIPATLPLPDVVYNRIPTRNAEQRKSEQQALQYLGKTLGIPLFNPGFFNKWTLYQFLRQSGELAELVPATGKWNADKPPVHILKRFPTVYLKPNDGLAGNGMIRIARNSSGYEVVLQTLKEKKRFPVRDMANLLKLLRRVAGKRSYVWQQGIPLATFRGRPFDLRILLQKGGNGRWGITGIGIRVAGPDAISTHVPMGGTIENQQSVLKTVFGDRCREVTRRIEETALRIARQIERSQEGNIGEMSIDMGIEKSGRLWFFEANAKPMKFDEPDIRERSLKRLIQYSLYLSGFQGARRKGGASL
jgi:hypothetical protein